MMMMTNKNQENNQQSEVILKLEINLLSIIQRTNYSRT